MSNAFDLVLYVGVLVTLSYLIYRYARYSRWEDSDAGRAFMGMKVCLLMLTLYAFATVLGLDGTARDVARVIVVGGIWAALTYQVLVMVRRQGGFHQPPLKELVSGGRSRRDPGGKVPQDQC